MAIPISLFYKFWDMTERNDQKRIASQTPTPFVTEVCDIQYIDDNTREHRCDIYYPDDKKGKLPLIIDIHGGGWLYGYKEINKYYNLFLASNGFNVISLNYTLCPKATIDGEVREIFDAFHWIDEIKDTYDLDLDNVYLTGDSAGGQLAAIVTSLFSRQDLRELYDVTLPSFTFNAVGYTCGAFDISFLTKLPVTKHYAEAMLGKDFKNSKYAPFTNLSDILKAETSFPPIWMISSKEDFIGFCSNKFDKLLTEKGIYHEYVRYGKSKNHSLPHVFNVTNPEYEESQEANCNMLSFFNRYRK